MEIKEINKFAQEIVKRNVVVVLLKSLLEEIIKQKGYNFFITGATDVQKTFVIRYLFFVLPEDKEVKKIESKLIELVKFYNSKSKNNRRK